MGSDAYLEEIQQLRADDAQGALNLVDRARKQADLSVEELTRLAHALDERKQRIAALTLLEEALRREPTAAEPAYTLAMLYLEQQQDARAVEVLKPVLAAQPDHDKANLTLAMALAKTEPSQARAHAARAAKSPDEDVRAQAQELEKVLAEHASR
ncbi:Beta-barrel assembly-enhancing protease [Corallococcus coralloides]|uniref:Beta-barrel assembly-enhancing protease n=1 Tax=Corallococcus coralloides TaxID=184914 RepID=A0A410RKU0_CORCK|nr:tetratricopeptide repeat protein [Corallococcus coralloides]QAT82520.1 Beta-barrel assembly-enhancing protease [Corallococcus coralloides]